MALTFAVTHNMIAYLTKSNASEGFDQIIDFLNASSIKYALNVNPNKYVSCIKQFWSSVSIKKVNDVIRLQALVDRKKVIITEAIVQEALRLDDTESIDCLPNEEIFTELSTMGYEKPSTKLTFYKAFFSPQWKKFNFSKYIFDMRNVDSSTKFYMYPRFLQLMIQTKVGDLSSHTKKYSSPAITQKLFANMRRVGKGFFGVDTPLFEGMIVAQQADDVADEGVAGVDIDVIPAAADEPSIPSPTPTTQPPPSQELPSTSQVIPTPPPSPIVEPSSPSQLQQPTHNAEILMDLLHTLLETCKTLTRKVEALEQDKVGTVQRVESSRDTVMDDVSKQGEIIDNIDADEDVTLKDVAVVAKKVEVEKDVETEEDAYVQGRQADTDRRRKGVVIRDPEETAAPSIIIHTEPKSKDKGKGIMVEEPKPLKKQAQIEKEKEHNAVLRYQALKRKPQTEAQARKNMMIYLRNMARFKMDYFKRMSYDDIRPIFEKHFNSNVAFLEKTKEQMEEEDNKALKRISESLEEKAVKK
nr:hypothetical protein [Tanacetum cinerariifolium]